ncbi:MAG: MaoC family dehydratase [Novosphingobium sp.]|nr:MaoC family dehydratase [Novosphingobium sp.]
MACGKSWRSLHIGWKAQTYRRTVTEGDLISFISATGMLEVTFTDAGHAGAMGCRPVPAALTYCFIEGMQLQTMIQGTGLALLEVNILADAPVRVGDTVWAVVEVSGIDPTSRGDRAVVAFEVTVFNQDGKQVMRYQVKRLMAGKDPEQI